MGFDFFENEELLKKNNIQYTEEQYEYIKYDKPYSLIISSVAGSGKTASCVGRLHHLIETGVNPSRLLFLSFTTDAVGELKERINNDDINVSTIHSFCLKLLAKNKKYRNIISFNDFIPYYGRRVSRSRGRNGEKMLKIYTKMRDNPDMISSEISAYKLNKAINIRCKMPDCYPEYREFLYEKRSYDFSDLIINTYKLLQNKEIRDKYKGIYDHIFVDEYQDTSVLQMRILMYLNAKQYYLIGDRNQAIYTFSGNNYMLVEKELKTLREVKKLNLTKNFRSTTSIVDNSNIYSDLNAIPSTEKKGKVYKKLINMSQLIKLIEKYDNIAILARTNQVVRNIELDLLREKIKIKYKNFINKKDIENYETDDVNGRLQNKLYSLYNSKFGDDDIDEKVISFIKNNHHLTKIVTTIHKSKGREYDCVVVVNSLSKDILEHNDSIYNNLDEKSLKRITFSPNYPDYIENKNIHYVAITRPKKALFYMYYPEQIE